jgi:hypothetical protein
MFYIFVLVWFYNKYNLVGPNMVAKQKKSTFLLTKNKEDLK